MQTSGNIGIYEECMPDWNEKEVTQIIALETLRNTFQVAATWAMLSTGVWHWHYIEFGYFVKTMEVDHMSKCTIHLLRHT